MDDLKIDGLFVSPLKQIIDDRGAVLHYLKSTSPSFKGFGEAYYSRINKAVIKGWKLHTRISQNFCVPFGIVRFVVFDPRDNSHSKGCIDEIIIDSEKNYSLLSMPPGLWYSFKCESQNFALLANIIDEPHSPNEAENLPLNNNIIPYEWSEK